MNDQMKHYKQYERIMKMELEQSAVKTSEYQSFSELYPHIAESIRLKRKIERLTNILKSEKHSESEFKIKREITVTKSKLRKNNLLKRLHGESKQEAIFRRKFKRSVSKMRYSLFAKKCRTILGRPIRNFQRKLSRSMHKNLPPSLFNLRELDVSENGLALKEWLQEKRNELR
ncbi:MAG: hypothetical protein ABIH76_00100 [Candidatus Bathyarchaeota archaeon]